MLSEKPQNFKNLRNDVEMLKWKISMVSRVLPREFIEELNFTSDCLSSFNNQPTRLVERVSKGRLKKQKTVNLITFIKKGGRVRILWKQISFLQLWHMGVGGELCMTQFSLINFSIFNLFLAYLHGNFQYFSYFWLNLVQIVEILFNFCWNSSFRNNFFSKLCLNLLRGRGGRFFIFVTITLGGWGSVLIW